MKVGIFEWLGALNDPTRARLLNIVDRHELSVGEVCSILQAPQSTVSRHLKVLADEGWVRSRRDGTSRLYRLSLRDAPQAKCDLWRWLQDSLSEQTVVELDEQRLELVLRQREASRENYFDNRAGEWDRLRDERYGLGLELPLLSALLPDNARAADLGCGTGRLSQHLAPFSERLYCIDANREMIKACKRRLSAAPNAQIQRGRLEKLPLETSSLDVAFSVLVLHYISAPKQALEEAGRVLKPGGTLILMDLQPHEETYFSSESGQVWPGFSSEQIMGWLTAAGFGSATYQKLPARAESKGPPLFVCRATQSHKTQSPTPLNPRRATL